MRKIALSLGLAAVTGASLIAVSTTATAAENTAQAACFTLWESAGFNDGSRIFAANDADFAGNNWSNGRASNDDANAAKNTCTFAVAMHADASYRGQSYSIQRSSQDADFANNAFSNKASSVSGF